MDGGAEGEGEKREEGEGEKGEGEEAEEEKGSGLCAFSFLPSIFYLAHSHPNKITRHVAAILQRQEFILKLARAMMMFGGPSHRLVAQIQSTARVLELEMSCMYLPDVMWISFEDSATGTSNVKFIRQGSALDLGKLGEAHGLYWDVRVSSIRISNEPISPQTLRSFTTSFPYPQQAPLSTP